MYLLGYLKVEFCSEKFIYVNVTFSGKADHLDMLSKLSYVPIMYAAPIVGGATAKTWARSPIRLWSYILRSMPDS